MSVTADRLEATEPWADAREREAIVKADKASALAKATERLREAEGTLTIHATPDVIARFRAQPGTDDLDRLLGLLAQAA